MVDNNNIKRLGMIGYSGKCLVGAKGERKLSSRITERERQGVPDAKLIVNGKNVYGPSHGRVILASMTRTSRTNTLRFARVGPFRLRRDFRSSLKLRRDLPSSHYGMASESARQGTVEASKSCLLRQGFGAPRKR
jgi:hypothetical protein